MSKFVIYKGQDKGEECFRWKLIDDNDKNIARSEEPFLVTSIQKSIKTMQTKVGVDTPIYEDESLEDKDKGYRFEYSQSKNDNQWYWKLRAGNNETMAIGGEGFSSKQSVVRSIENVRLEIPRATIEWDNEALDPANKAKDNDTTPTKGLPGS